MNKKLKGFINLILVLALIFCGVKVVISLREGAESQKDYDEASALAGIQEPETPTEAPETTPTEAARETEPATEPTAAQPKPIPDDPVIHQLMETDLDSLRAENEDVIGWITIPDTVVSYPLLQWTDNEFYLEHTWKQTKNINGSIFMECQNSPDFTDFNTIIYGHNMNTGAMFGALKYYKREAYWQQHPSFYIVSDQGVLRYDIFAVHKVSTQTIVYGLDLETDQQRTAFLRFARDYSSIDTGIEPTVDDHIVTLSTCTGQGHSTRWVVQGVLNESGSYRFEE